MSADREIQARRRQAILEILAGERLKYFLTADGENELVEMD
jgi:hypothetical protein